MRRKTDYTPTPLFLSLKQLLKRLNRSTSWFYQHREELEARGFPLKSDTFGGWYEPAVIAFLNQHSGLTDATDPFEAALDRALCGPR